MPNGEQKSVHATPTGLKWRRSGRCSVNHCVEVAFGPDDEVHLRDSKQGLNGQMLTFTREEWDAFLVEVKAGNLERASEPA